MDTKRLLVDDLLDMDDTENLGLLSEQETKQRRGKRNKILLLLLISFTLLVVYGVWAVTGEATDAEGWRHHFIWRQNGQPEIRQAQDGREQYLLGVGKADITG